MFLIFGNINVNSLFLCIFFKNCITGSSLHFNSISIKSLLSIAIWCYPTVHIFVNIFEVWCIYIWSRSQIIWSFCHHQCRSIDPWKVARIPTLSDRLSLVGERSSVWLMQIRSKHLRSIVWYHLQLGLICSCQVTFSCIHTRNSYWHWWRNWNCSILLEYWYSLHARFGKTNGWCMYLSLLVILHWFYIKCWGRLRGKQRLI